MSALHSGDENPVSALRLTLVAWPQGLCFAGQRQQFPVTWCFLCMCVQRCWGKRRFYLIQVISRLKKQSHIQMGQEGSFLIFRRLSRLTLCLQRQWSTVTISNQHRVTDCSPLPLALLQVLFMCWSSLSEQHRTRKGHINTEAWRWMDLRRIELGWCLVLSSELSYTMVSWQEIYACANPWLSFSHFVSLSSLGIGGYQTAILADRTIQESPSICYYQLPAHTLVCSLQGKSVYLTGFMSLGRVELYLRLLLFPRHIIDNLYFVCSHACGLVI